jgi:hypothetical protein
LGALAASACFRDRDADSPEISVDERAAFTAPADSSLTPDQVERYLRTMLAQFELVAAEAPSMRRQIAAGDGAVAKQAGTGRDSPMKRWSDFLTATYVRAARRADANPAEMEYVGDRIRRVGGYLQGRQAQASGGQMAALLRQQAEALRSHADVPPEQIDQMLQAADAAERQTVQPAPPAVQQNLDVLRSTRGRVTEPTWVRVAAVSGGVGLMALGDMADTTASGPVAQLSELREMYTAALENRAHPPGGDAPAR